MIEVAEAEQTAMHALAGVGTRLAHSRQVAMQASRAVRLMEPEWRAPLRAAAWLHDVGYAREASVLGFHPLDGARWLRDQGWPDQVTELVVWHTHAEKEAELLGVPPYDGEFPRPPAFVAAVLTWADLTSSPEGAACEPGERLEEILERYPHGSLVHEVIQASWPVLMDDVAAVRRALEASGGQES